MKQLPFFFVPLAVCSMSALARADMGGASGWGLGASGANSTGQSANGYSVYSMHDYALLSPWRDNAAWNQPQGTQNTISRHDFTQALTQQIPVLGMISGWRNTFRGEGATARREWKFGGDGKDATVLSMGTQALPQYQFLGLSGNATGMGLSVGRFSFGSTVMSAMMQKFADSYDSATDGKAAPKTRDASTYTWMTAQAMNNAHGQLDLVMMRVNRDTTPGQAENKKMIDGTSMGMRADLKLWADWKMRGEWMNNRRQNGDAANAWHLEMGGPFRNPLGITQVNFWMDARQPGFAAMNDMRPSTGYSNMKMVMQQNITMGKMQTALQWTGTKNENLALKISNGNEHDSDSSEAKADMSWKLSPILMISANYYDFNSHKNTISGQDLNDNSTSNETAKANLNWQVSSSLSTTLNVLTQNSEQSTTNGNVVYSNQTNHQESSANVNWKVSPELTASGSVSTVNNDVKAINGTTSNLDNLNSQDARANFNWKLTPAISAVANVATTNSVRDTGSLPDALNAAVTRRQEVGGGVQWQLSSALALSATTSQVRTYVDLVNANSELAQPSSRQNDQQLSLGLTHRTKAGSWNVQVTQHDLNDPAVNNLATQGQTISLQTERQILPNLRVKGTWNMASDADLANRLANERAARSIEAQWGLTSRSNLSINYSDWNNLQSRPNFATSLGSNQLGLRFNWGSAVKGNGLGLAVEYSRQDTTDPNQRQRYKVGLTYK